jgi:hypothetical protein
MQRFEYEETISYNPSSYDYDFVDRVKKGWRLSSVVKESKDRFVYFWERPYNG